jgi:hypothetical protein
MWRQRNHSASSGHATMVGLTVFIAIASATGVADKASGRVGTAPSAIMKPPGRDREWTIRRIGAGIELA